eukprot:SAG31_NODE_86_length_26973_cov_16.850897_20_plen_110_part_00
MQEVTLSVQLCTTDRTHSRGARPALVTTGQRPGPEAAPAAHLSTYHRPVPGGIPETISSSVYKCETAASRRPSPNKALLSYFLTYGMDRKRSEMVIEKRIGPLKVSFVI